jgi:hypothetical protein
MKIIDEKGKLFGKINVLDFLAILFLIYLTPVFYFGYKIFIKKQATPAVTAVPIEPVKIELELIFDFRNLDAKTLGVISVGDKEIDEKGQVIGEILRLEEPAFQTHKVNVGGKIRVKKDRELKHMLATLRVKPIYRLSRVYYKDKQIDYDSPINFITDKYTLEAIFISPVKSTPLKFKFPFVVER